MGEAPLRALRRQLGWSQAAVSAELGLTQNAYCRCEKQERPRRAYVLALQLLVIFHSARRANIQFPEPGVVR